jgi:hypothetical protein
MSVLRATLTALLCVSFTASRVSAQEPVTSFDELAATTKPHTRIRLTGTDGRTMDGTVSTLTSSQLVVTSKSGMTYSFRETDVRRIDERGGIKPWRTLTGAAIGAVGTWLYAYGVRDCGACDYRASAALLVGGAIGAGIGLPFDLRRMSWPIFSLPDHATVALSPVISAHKSGVVATVGF